MILRILKSNQPVNFILTPLIAVIFWIKDLIQPEIYPYYPGENENLLFQPIQKLVGSFAVLPVLLSLILVIVLAFQIQQINSRYAFIRIRNMLPAPVFILLISGFVKMHTLHPVYFSALFLLFAVNRLFSVFDQPKPYSAIFDSAFLLGIGSLFYFNSIFLFPAFFAGIAVLGRDNRWRNYIVLIIGFLLPYFFAFSYGILTRNLMELLKTYERNIITPTSLADFNISLYLFLAFIIILTIIGSIKIIQQYDTKKVSSRKYFTVFFFIFITAIAGFVFVPATSLEMLVLMVIPVCFLISNFLVFMKSTFWGNLILLSLLSIVVYMQFAGFSK